MSSKCCLSVLSLVMAAGCGSDARVIAPENSTQDPGQPLYVLGSGVSGVDNETTYFTPLSSLDASANVDLTRAIERQGVGRLYGADGLGYFAIGLEESQSITRYEVSADGRFVEGPSVSLQNYGVTFMAEANAIHFVSPTKAYYLDWSQLQVLIWNPEAMTIDGSLDLGSLLRAGTVPSFSARLVRRGDQVLFAAGWQDPDFNGVQSGISLISIDTNTDALSIQPADDRCRDPGELAVLEDGTLYVMSNFTNVFGKFRGGNGVDDCVLRVLPGANTFDPEYVGSLAAAVGGAPAVGIVQRDASTLWALTVDENVATSRPEIGIGDFLGTALWRWARIDLPSLATGSIDAERGLTVFNDAYFVDGHLFIPESTADYSSTTLLDVTGDEPVPGISFPGYVGNIVRLR